MRWFRGLLRFPSATAMPITRPTAELADILFPDPGWTGKQHMVENNLRHPAGRSSISDAMPNKLSLTWQRELGSCLNS